MLNSIEVNRKLIHLSSLIYPVLYLVLDDRGLMVGITASVLVLLVISEILRKNIPAFEALYNRLFGFTLRTQEKHRVTGATYFLLGALLTVALFEAPVAILGLIVLIISDSCASLVGLQFQSRKLVGKKSLAGTLAFAVSAALIGFAGGMFFDLAFWPLLLAALAATLLELFSTSLRIDDNILIPLGFAAVASLLG